MDPDKVNEPAAGGTGVPRRQAANALGHRYLRAVLRLEALPGNQPRADKSWVEETLREFRNLVTRAKRVR